MHEINSHIYDLGSEKEAFERVILKDLTDTVTYLGGVYQQLLADSLDDKDAVSSGNLSDSIKALDITINGSIYRIDIEAAKYATFIDEGVDGWAKSRGSKLRFRTKGVDPKGEMVQSLKAWLKREGNTNRNVKVGIDKREIRGKSIMDASTKAAVSAAYMIKRQGIKPTHFWRDATREMQDIAQKELGIAFKVDIINNLTT